MGKWSKSNKELDSSFFDSAAADQCVAPDEVLNDPIALLEWLASREGSPDSLTPQTKRWDEPAKPSKQSAAVEASTAVAGESIDNLVELRPTLRMRLKENGITTIEQLQAIPRWEILRFSGFGQSRISEINAALQNHLHNSAQGKDYPPEPLTYGGHKTELDYLLEMGLPYVDRRSRGGALWVIGDRLISDKLKYLKRFGFFFYYKPEGSTSTEGRSAWWTKTGTKKITDRGVPSVSEANQQKVPSAAIGSSSSKQTILVRSKLTGEKFITVSEVVYARPYGPSTAVDTYDNWYICPQKFIAFSKYLEGDSFVFVTNENGFTGAVRMDVVTSVVEKEPGLFELYIELADEHLSSVGKPSDWYIEAFGKEKVTLLDSGDQTEQDRGSVEKAAAPKIDEEEPYVASPELIALLYGIACDGRVNIREAKMLRKWLSSVSGEDNKAIRDIKALLEKVLDDDVVTLAEEAEMLNLFSKIAGIVEEN